ncbi:MAG TPA: apolipoprotein N-acyltransferase, partial [Pyrinomonadaceae bacterium]
MHDAVAVEAPNRKLPVVAAARASAPTLAEVSLVIASALLLILSFPNFELWPLAWIGLAPFLLVAARPLRAGRAFLLGWLWGAVFFYGTCWWLTYPMVHYAHISACLAYPLLVLPIALVALFPALFSLFLSRLVARFGLGAIFAAPLLWVSCEWARYAVTGQLWNALGYSQAFHPLLIQPARWGGVYTISFLLLAVNVAVAFLVLRRSASAVILSLALLILTALALAGAFGQAITKPVFSNATSTLVIAVQPYVPMEGADDPAAMEQLLNRHLELSIQGLRSVPAEVYANRLVIWPESPMNFSYSRDPHLRDVVTNFARSNHTLVLLNSLEPAPNEGGYNSAVMVNEEGRIVAQYDKIRLMPFGEYVPLPHWLPGASSVRGIVGDFTPGSSYTLMPLGAFRAGVFICIEAAHPGVARAFTGAGADVLINISNDGYLGPTPVMRQHLANAIFRAVENNRLLLRVTNNGISAYIDPSGIVMEETSGFKETVRAWPVRQNTEARTCYTAHGDLLAYA